MPQKITAEYVTLHGDQWKWIDIQESVEWVRTQQWKKKKWVARDALISKKGATDYVGQKYNPEHTKLVADDWDHDHCEICWWFLHEAEEPEHGEGFTSDGHHWICAECFNQFIASVARME